MTKRLPLYTSNDELVDMKQLDLVATWIDTVAISHSNSNRTRQKYKSIFQLFCKLIGKTPEQIKAEYDNYIYAHEERKLRRQYAQYIQAFMSAQSKEGLAQSTIRSRVAIIKSFFKYNDLPLGHVPAIQLRITYHNRDITHNEVRLILGVSRPREKAYFTVMAQGGLRPDTICNLRYENIEEDLTYNRIPCKIEVPQEIAKGKYRSYFTFIGEEAVHYLQAYLNTRPNIADEDYLFLKEGTDEKTNPKSFSNLFARTVRKLQNKGLIKVKQKQKGKPRDVRLYNLRKFFRKHANQAGFEYVQFWMGHIVNAGQDEHYRPTDVKYHRKLYTDKAMPFLRLESPTPSDTNKIITTLKEQHQKEMETIENKYKNENEDLKNRLTKIENMFFPKENEYEGPLLEEEDLKQMAKASEKHQKWLKKHPEELKKQEKWYEKMAQEEYPHQLEMVIQSLQTELNKHGNLIKELQNIVKQNKETEKQS